MPEITGIQFYGHPDGMFVAYVSCVIDGWLALHRMRIVRRPNVGDLLLDWPREITLGGDRRCLYHAVTPTSRERFERFIFNAFEQHMKRNAKH